MEEDSAAPAGATPRRTSPRKRSTGLMEEREAEGGRETKKARHVARRTVPLRSGPVWATVTVEPSLENQVKLQPRVLCKNCGKSFTANYNRIMKHILGGGDIAVCDPDVPSTDFLELREKLMEEAHTKTEKREDMARAKEVNSSAEKADMKEQYSTQTSIQDSVGRVTAEMCDDAIADFFLGDNIADNVANSPRFKRMVRLLRLAPPDYKPPDRRRIGNDLLLSTTTRMHKKNEELKQAVLHNCGTVISDGWDDVERNHLINFLVGTCKGMFFDGTIELTVSPHSVAMEQKLAA